MHFNVQDETCAREAQQVIDRSIYIYCISAANFTPLYRRGSCVVFEINVSRKYRKINKRNDNGLMAGSKRRVDFRGVVQRHNAGCAISRSYLALSVSASNYRRENAVGLPRRRSPGTYFPPARASRRARKMRAREEARGGRASDEDAAGTIPGGTGRDVRGK